MQFTYTKLLSNEAYAVCKKTGCTDSEVLPYIYKLCSAIAPEHRPSVTAVQMQVKRRLWNLTEL